MATGQTGEDFSAEAAFHENPGEGAGWDLWRGGSLSSWGLLQEERQAAGHLEDPVTNCPMTHLKDSKQMSSSGY